MTFAAKNDKVVVQTHKMYVWASLCGLPAYSLGQVIYVCNFPCKICSDCKQHRYRTHRSFFLRLLRKFTIIWNHAMGAILDFSCLQFMRILHAKLHTKVSNYFKIINNAVEALENAIPTFKCNNIYVYLQSGVVWTRMNKIYSVESY